MLQVSGYKKGMSIIWQGRPHIINDIQFTNPGKGAAFYKLKIKGLNTDKSLEITVKSGEKLEEADVSYKNAQFLYADQDSYHFMDQENYEQFELSSSLFTKTSKFFKEGVSCKTMYIDDQPCLATLPIKMVLEVKNSPPGVKGDTATGGTKFVTLETGAQIKVPLFIKEGEKIRINTDTGEYIERSNT